MVTGPPEASDQLGHWEHRPDLGGGDKDREVTMKQYLIPTLIIKLIAEMVASWWVWTSWPTDTLAVLYKGSFTVYELERLIPWIITVGVSMIFWFLVNRRRRKSTLGD